AGLRVDERAVEVAEDQLHPAGDAVEARVAGGEAERAQVAIDGGDALGVGRREQRVEPRAGAQVERGGDGAAGREAGQRVAVPTWLVHVVLGRGPAEASAGEPPAAAAGVEVAGGAQLGRVGLE